MKTVSRVFIVLLLTQAFLGCDKIGGNDPEEDYQNVVDLIYSQDTEKLLEGFEFTKSVSRDSLLNFMQLFSNKFDNPKCVSNDLAYEYHKKYKIENFRIVGGIKNDEFGEYTDTYYFLDANEQLGVIQLRRDKDNVDALKTLDKKASTNPFAYNDDEFRNLFIAINGLRFGLLKAT